MSEFNPYDFHRMHRPPVVEFKEATGLLFSKFRRYEKFDKLVMPPVVYVDYYNLDDPDYPLLVDVYLFSPFENVPVFTHDYICTLIPSDFIILYHDCREFFPRVHFVTDFKDGDFDALNSVPASVNNMDLFGEI